MISNELREIIIDAESNFDTGRFENAGSHFDNISKHIDQSESLDWLYYQYRSLHSFKKANNFKKLVYGYLKIHREAQKNAYLMLNNIIESENLSLIDMEELLYTNFKLSMDLKDLEKTYSVAMSLLDLYPRLIEKVGFTGKFDYKLRYLQIAETLGDLDIMEEVSKQLIDLTLRFIEINRSIFEKDERELFSLAAYLSFALQKALQIMDETRIFNLIDIIDNYNLYSNINYEKYGFSHFESKEDFQTYYSKLTNTDIDLVYVPDALIIDLRSIINLFNDKVPKITAIKSILENTPNSYVFGTLEEMDRFDSSLYFKMLSKQNRVISINRSGRRERFIERVAAIKKAKIVTTLDVEHQVNFAFDGKEVILE